jgi:ABC-type phosphate/phosphonate transport system substrate-binding protein
MISALMLGACRRGGNATGPTLQPSFTYTPRSTLLPSLTPTIEPGSAENPIRLFILRPAGAATQGSLNNAANALADALAEDAGVAVEITLVNNDAESVRALCEAIISDVPTAAWVSGLGYSAAAGLDCAFPSLQVAREVGGDTQTGETVQIIVNDSLGITDIPSLEGRAFCRVDFSDLFTWIVPTLLLQSNGLDPISGPDAVRDLGDTQTVIDDVASGDCDAAGVSASDFADLTDSDTRDAIRTLNQTIAVPYAILMYTPAVPLGQRNALDEGLLALGADGAASLGTLLNADDVIRVEEGALDDWTAFIGRTDLDFSQWRSS